MASKQDDTVLNMQQEGHSVSDELQFQDIAHDAYEDPPDAKVQTHNFTNFPNHDDSEDDDSQQANLIKGEGGRKGDASFWTFAYYQGFFDVETHQVLTRILGSVVPNPRRNFLKYHIRPNPDFYGPFWICVTLVFTTAIAGNMANYFQQSGQDYKWTYDFHKVTFAATAIFSYWWIIPSLLYGVLWWRGSQAGYTYTEILSVYGYSLAIYIPISILWVIQISWLQWLLVMVGMTLSGSVLVFTFWPAVQPDNKKIALLVTSLIVIFHGALAVGFVMYFFHVPAVTVPAGGVVNATTTPALVEGPQLNDDKQAHQEPGLPAGQQEPGLPAGALHLEQQPTEAPVPVENPPIPAENPPGPAENPPISAENPASDDQVELPAVQPQPDNLDLQAPTANQTQPDQQPVETDLLPPILPAQPPA